MNRMADAASKKAVGALVDAAEIEGMPQAKGPMRAITDLGGLVVAWHISTRSPDNGGSCVEAGPVLDGSGRIAVRHSHSPDGAVILYTKAEWEAFVAGVRNGEFDFFA